MKKISGVTLVFVIIVLVLFLFASYISQQYNELIEKLISQTELSLFFYFFAIILESVFAPITMIPLIPLASAIWGWFIAGFITLLGWTTGSTIAFLLARTYGAPYLEKKDLFEKIRRTEEITPTKNIFLGIILLRITVPIDLLNYALGLFTKISWKQFAIASSIGYIPMSFILAYLGTFPLKLQIALAAIGSIFVFIILFTFYKNKDFREHVKESWEKEFRKR